MSLLRGLYTEPGWKVGNPPRAVLALETAEATQDAVVLRTFNRPGVEPGAPHVNGAAHFVFPNASRAIGLSRLAGRLDTNF